MLFKKNAGTSCLYRSMRVKYIPTGLISDPSDPERTAKNMDDLVYSIAHMGVINPLIVRAVPPGYQVICGSRRLRAAAECGLEKVPCVVTDCGDDFLEMLRIAENHQRLQPDFAATAEGLRQLVYTHGLSIGEAAKAMGIGFDDATEKLRALRLGDRLLSALTKCGLGQKHAISLLRLDENAREAALCEMAYRGIDENAADKYVSALLSHGEKPAPSASRPLYIMKDVRLFLNTLEHGVSIMRAAGIAARLSRESVNSDMVITITIPGAAEQKNAG